MKLVEILRRLPKPVPTALAFLSVALLLLLDYVTGPELSPLIFYVVPIVVVVWFVGRSAAVFLSAAAAFAWLLADLMSGRPYAHPAIPYWNGAEKLIFFLLVTPLVTTLKTTLEREIRIAEQVQERLFPQRTPPLETLECAGTCRPVRSVGATITTSCLSRRAASGLRSGMCRERVSRRRFGEARLEALVRAHGELPARSLCERILHEVPIFLETEPAQDDLTVLVARALPAPG